MPTTDLNHFIRIYDHHLNRGLCERLITAFEKAVHLQQRNGRQHNRGLEESAWTEMNVSHSADPQLLSFFRTQMDEALAKYNRDVGLPIAIPNSAKTSDLILKRYQAGANERFQIHFDSLNEVSNRYLVLLWYLNDVDAGGETVFPDTERIIRPAAGRLLIFPPYWMYQHAGRAPTSGPKYILSTYLLF